ncbi:MAG: YgiT-type zinc finger protein [Blastocatellia bacterium]
MKNGKKKQPQSKDKEKSQPQSKMENIRKSPCSDCGGQVRRKAISQEFEREGIRIKISGVQAWVCSRCGGIYFEPGGADRLVKAANCLFALALAEKQHKGKVVAALS